MTYFNCVQKLSNDDKNKLISPDSPRIVREIAEKIGIALSDYQSDIVFSNIRNTSRYNVDNDRILMAAGYIYTEAI
ncbi:MAG: hypothetical protein Q4F95_14570 [Oscillospiraceae bacterium]|nr:hypothetical protein [Oscillospiraceae bacterium]